MLKSSTALLAGLGLVALSLGACGQAGNDSEGAADTTVSADVTVDGLDAPDRPGASEASVTPSAPPQIAAREPGVYTNGDLVARIETAALSAYGQDSRRDGFLRLGMAITFANGGSQPMSLILRRDASPSFLLANGITIRDRQNWEVTGLGVCRYDSASECRLRAPDSFVEIEPGQSITVNIVLTGEYLASHAGTLNSYTTGNLTMGLYLLQGDSVERSIALSMPNMPISNNVSL